MNRKTVKQTLVASFLLLSVVGFISCEKYVWDPPKIDNTKKIDFQTDVAPIFSSCIVCHGAAQVANLDLRPENAFASIQAKGLVNTANPEASGLYQKIVGGHNSSGVSDIQKQTLLLWITQGAKLTPDAK